MVPRGRISGVEIILNVTVYIYTADAIGDPVRYAPCNRTIIHVNPSARRRSVMRMPENNHTSVIWGTRTLDSCIRFIRRTRRMVSLHDAGNGQRKQRERFSADGTYGGADHILRLLLYAQIWHRMLSMAQPAMRVFATNQELGYMRGFPKDSLALVAKCCGFRCNPQQTPNSPQPMSTQKTWIVAAARAKYDSSFYG